MPVVFYEKVFDKYVKDSAVYTDPVFNERLGSADKLVVQANASNTSGASPALTIKSEDSNDELSWNTSGAKTLVNAQDVSSNPTQFGADDGSTPNARFVRLRASFDSGKAGHVVIYVAGRTD